MEVTPRTITLSGGYTDKEGHTIIMEVTPRTITLSGGYTDKEGHIHRDVTFGRRLQGKDLFAIDSDKQANIPAQYDSLLMRPAITKFGELSLPVTLQALLSLAKPDREDLSDAFNQFQLETAGDRTPEYVSNNVVHLAFGFILNDITYNVVTFGRQCTGFDEVAADKEGLEGLGHECFLIGREIASLSQTDGSATVDGPIELQFFQEVDAADIANLRLASQLWRNSFRRPGGKVQDRDGVVSDAAGAET
jgi:hypothetical protein